VSGIGWTPDESERIRAGGVEKNVELIEAEEREGDAIDAAYRAKYGRYPTYVERMVSSPARDTTMELVPRAEDARTPAHDIGSRRPGRRHRKLRHRVAHDPGESHGDHP